MLNDNNILYDITLNDSTFFSDNILNARLYIFF